MAVGNDALSQRRITNLLPPALRKTDEELLIRGQIHDAGRGLAECQPVGVVGDREARYIGDVLTQGLPAVHAQIRERPVGVELRDEERRGGLEMREVLLGPPVVELSV